jgi:hypothetical protein
VLFPPRSSPPSSSDVLAAERNLTGDVGDAERGLLGDTLDGLGDLAVTAGNSNGKPIDLVIVRENTEDLYVKEERTIEGPNCAERQWAMSSRPPWC